jgi:hypothetical protein
MKFQLETRTLLEIGPEKIHINIVAKNLSAFCPGPETSWASEFKSAELINLAEDNQDSQPFRVGFSGCF